MRTLLAVLSFLLFAALPAFSAVTGVVMTSDGQPVAGARVLAFALELPEARAARITAESSERIPLAFADTNAKGAFSVDTAKERYVSLQINAPGYAPETAQGERDEELGALVLQRVENRSGKLTAAGKPAAGAKVVFSGAAELIVTTDEQGRYSVADPVKWAYTVLILHPDYATVEESTRAFGSKTFKLDRTLEKGVAITGKVVSTDGKTPLAKAELTINGLPVAVTGEDGSFNVAHAPTKWRTIQARSGDLVGASAFTKSAAVIRMTRGASVSGSVRDAKTQAAVANMPVSLFPGSGMGARTRTTFTDAKGNYSITGILPGSYDVRAVRQDYSMASISASLAAADKATKNLLVTQLARVSGTVLDEGKRPVPVARMRPQMVSRESSMMQTQMTGQPIYSGPDGRFTVRAGPDADLQIEANRKGYPVARSVSMRLSPGERKSGVVIIVPSGVAVTGKVTDRDGKPLSGVSVAAGESRGEAGMGMIRRVTLNSMFEREDSLKTAADGSYEIRVKEGTWDFAFHREGFAAKSVRAQQLSASTPKEIDVTLDPGVSISGRVTRSGAGLAGVVVNSFGDSAPSMAETGADGSFRIDDLTPGQVILNVSKEDEFIRVMRPVTAPATGVDIEIPPGGRVSGRVVDKTTRQPVTSFEAGISSSGGGVGMVMMFSPRMRPFTSEDGSFLLENVPAGSQIQLLVAAPGYTTARLPNVKVEEGKEVADLTVELDRGVRVGGRVTGPEGGPLSGVSVRIDVGTSRGGMPPPPMNRSGAVTDSNGEYSIEAVEAGEKMFIFNRTGYVSVTKSVTLSGSEARVDAQLGSGVRVSGVVVTEGGAPVEDASVSARSGAEAASYRGTRTDANGGFVLEGLAPGRYRFSASKTGYATGEVEDVDVSTTSMVRIQLRTGGTVTGHVTGLTAAELQQAIVMVNSVNSYASAAVDASGNYRVDGAPTGTVRIMARTRTGIGGGRSSQMQSRQLEPGQSIQADIDFGLGSIVTGRVARDGKPVDGAMVGFIPKGIVGQSAGSATTDSGGRYEISGLQDGKYDVSAGSFDRGGMFMGSYEVRGSGNFDIELRSSSLRGRVIDAATSEPVGDASIELQLLSQDAFRFPMRMIQTDAGGNFTIDGIAPGSYRVSADKEGYGKKGVEVRVGDSTADVEIKLARSSGVTLRVVDARDGRLLSAFIRVLDAQNNQVYASPFRFSSGSAETATINLEPGSYTALVTADGYAARSLLISSPSTQTVGLTPGGSLAIQSKGSSLRRGRLLGANGRVYSRSGFGDGAFAIDPSPGVTVLENIAPGPYTLQILEGTSVVGSVSVTVVEGQRGRTEI